MFKKMMLLVTITLLLCSNSFADDLRQKTKTVLKEIVTICYSYGSDGKSSDICNIISNKIVSGDVSRLDLWVARACKAACYAGIVNDKITLKEILLEIDEL